MKNHHMGLNYHLPFILLLPLRMLNGPSFQQLINACSGTMVLPRGSYNLPLPAEEELFEVFDSAFANSYFGLS